MREGHQQKQGRRSIAANRNSSCFHYFAQKTSSCFLLLPFPHIRKVFLHPLHRTRNLYLFLSIHFKDTLFLLPLLLSQKKGGREPLLKVKKIQKRTASSSSNGTRRESESAELSSFLPGNPQSRRIPCLNLMARPITQTLKPIDGIFHPQGTRPSRKKMPGITGALRRDSKAAPLPLLPHVDRRKHLTQLGCVLSIRLIADLTCGCNALPVSGSRPCSRGTPHRTAHPIPFQTLPSPKP
jgi:hypothetical protein